MKQSVLALSVALALAGVGHAANLLTNPGFEGSLTGWTQTGWNYDDSGWVPEPQDHSGSGHAGRSLGGGGPLVTGWLYQNVSVTPGARYAIGGFLGGDGLNDGAKNVVLAWTDGSFNGSSPTPVTLKTQNIVSSNGMGIAGYYHNFTVVTPTASTIAICLRGTLNGNGGTHVDDMYIRPITDFDILGGPITVTDNMNGTYLNGLPTTTGGRSDQIWSKWREGWDGPGTNYTPSQGSGGPGVDAAGSHIRENGNNGALNTIGGCYRDFPILISGSATWTVSAWLNANGNAASGNNFWWEWHAMLNTQNDVGNGSNNRMGGDSGGFAKHDGWGSNIGAGWVQASNAAPVGSGAKTAYSITSSAIGDYIRVWSKCGWQASRANPFLVDYVQVTTATPVEDWMVY